MLSELNKLTNKSNILLTSRGNKAILFALKIAKNRGYTKLYLADQGSWITYAQYGKKLKFDILELKTDRGLINFDDIKEDSAVIFNDMPSYAFLQNELKEKKKNVLYIGDITGTIGTRTCNADILVCSFGEHKIINLGYGGMLASNEIISLESDFKDNDELLERNITNIQKRLKFLRTKREKILSELKSFDIIHPDKNGINILVKFKDEEEKVKILNYCKKTGLEYKLCPMRIKILETAVSIEIQNLN